MSELLYIRKQEPQDKMKNPSTLNPKSRERVKIVVHTSTRLLIVQRDKKPNTARTTRNMYMQFNNVTSIINRRITPHIERK